MTLTMDSSLWTDASTDRGATDQPRTPGQAPARVGRNLPSRRIPEQSSDVCRLLRVARPRPGSAGGLPGPPVRHHPRSGMRPGTRSGRRGSRPARLPEVRGDIGLSLEGPLVWPPARPCPPRSRDTAFLPLPQGGHHGTVQPLRNDDIHRRDPGSGRGMRRVGRERDGRRWRNVGERPGRTVRATATGHHRNRRGRRFRPPCSAICPTPPRR